MKKLFVYLSLLNSCIFAHMPFGEEDLFEEEQVLPNEEDEVCFEEEFEFEEGGDYGFEEEY